MKNKIVSLILIISVFSAIFLSQKPLTVSAETVTTAEFSGVANWTPMAFVYQKMGEAFNATQTVQLETVSFPFKRTNNPTGSISAIVANASGTYGTNALPTTIIAYSNYYFNVASVGTGTTWVNFTFNPGTILYANTKYTCYFYLLPDATLDGSNYLSFGQSTATNPYGGNCIGQYTTWWADNDEDVNFKVEGNTDLSLPTETTWDINLDFSPSVTWNFPEYGDQAVTYQSINYTVTGQTLNNSIAIGDGTFSVYKTAVEADPGSVDFNSLTLNQTGTVTDGVFSFSQYSEYVLDSVMNFQGLRINATLDGVSEVLNLDIWIAAAEPDVYFIGSVVGGHFGSTPAVIAQAPTEVYMNQRTVYTYIGETFFDNMRQGTGNFTTYSTGLGTTSAVWTIGTYTLVTTGNITGGVFSFNFASRESTQTVYEGYRVFVQLDDGKNYTANYYFSWRIDVFADPDTPVVPTDLDGLSGSMMTIINFLILFLLMGVPAFLLGVKAGLPGLIVGGVFGLGVGTIAGLVPFWFIFLVGVGIVAALFMWRRNNGQG